MPFSLFVLQHDAAAGELARAIDLAFCDVLLLAGHCDGEFAEEEALFATIFSTLTLTPDYYAVRAAGFAQQIASKGLSAVKTQVLDALTEVLARVPASAEELSALLRAELFESLSTMAVADRVLRDSERRFIVDEIAPRLGLTALEADLRLTQRAEPAAQNIARGRLLVELYVWMMDSDPNAAPTASRDEPLDPELADFEHDCAAASLQGPAILGTLSRVIAGQRGFEDLASSSAAVLNWARETREASREHGRAVVLERLRERFQALSAAEQRQILGPWFFIVSLQDGLTNLQRAALSEVFAVLGLDADAIRNMAQTMLLDNPFFHNSVVGRGDQWAGLIPSSN